ncbi:MAG: 2'-5' RNA ligase family protein [Bryobacteraceae bacterium]
MILDPVDSDRYNQVAVVSYISGELGTFLDRLREELVAGCKPHAHVTILPPRLTTADLQTNCRTIDDRLDGFGPFDVELIDVRIFKGSDVIYAALSNGWPELVAMHQAMDVEGLRFDERFPFHPHVTLAQQLDPVTVPEVFELARRRWEESVPARSFHVETLTFVQNKGGNNWIDLATFDLAAVRVRR